MKKLVNLLIVCCIFVLSGCTKEESYKLYTKNFIGPFDTITTYMSYSDDKDAFDEQCAFIQTQLNYYDRLFDKYTSYDDLNNIKTINDQAGIAPVKVDRAIIDMIEISIDRYHNLSSKVNIAFGSVLNIWHIYRDRAENNDGVGEIPSMDELSEANQYTDIDSIVIDKENQTIFISDSNVSIDVGATAKGYAVEMIKDGLIDLGVDNFLLSGGGNIASHGERKIKKEGSFYLDECQQKFCIGIQSPQDGNYSHNVDDPNYENEAVLVVDGESIVTSGDYQRYFLDEEGNRYHHLIDPATLFPSSYFRSVSIITEDSGLADFLSTAVFLMDVDEGLEFVNSLDGVEAVWLLTDGTIKLSDGLKDNEGFYVIDKSRLK